MTPRAAVFFDRDGVINRVVARNGGPASPRSLSELVVEPGVPAAVARLAAAGFPLFVVTNQPDVSRGLLDGVVLAQMSARLMAELPLDEVVACPHDDTDACGCRKPKPGMLRYLAQRWEIDLSRSFMIGDQDRDMACGRAAGCTTIQLTKPYNTGANADWRVSTLGQATTIILNTLIPTVMKNDRWYESRLGAPPPANPARDTSQPPALEESTPKAAGINE